MPETKPCMSCYGSGAIPGEDSKSIGVGFPLATPCEACGGTGKEIDSVKWPRATVGDASRGAVSSRETTTNQKEQA